MRSLFVRSLSVRSLFVRLLFDEVVIYEDGRMAASAELGLLSLLKAAKKSQGNG